MKNVAALAGVGIKTVSRVINGEPNVSATMSARVLAAAESLHFYPDLHAGNLRRANGRSNTLGLLVGSVSNPFSSAMHRAIEDVARTRGVAVFASSLDDDPAREDTAISAFLRRRMDGLILTTVSQNQGYLVPELRRGTPIVFVDREPGGIDADVVVSDNAAGAAAATRHLLAHGHRRIAFLGDRIDIQTARERRRGFLEELGRAGVATVDIPVITGVHDEEAGRLAMITLLDAENPPTAVFSSQNLITIGAVRGLRERNAQHSVALVGFDDVPLADLLDPGVTVVAQNPHEIGRLAAERIFARLDGDHSVGNTYIVPTNLIARGSGEMRLK